MFVISVSSLYSGGMERVIIGGRLYNVIKKYTKDLFSTTLQYHGCKEYHSEFQLQTF